MPLGRRSAAPSFEKWSISLRDDDVERTVPRRQRRRLLFNRRQRRRGGGVARSGVFESVMINHAHSGVAAEVRLKIDTPLGAAPQ